MNNAVMLDLETFGTGTNAAVVQLAVQPFNSLTGEFEKSHGNRWDVSLDSCLWAGGNVDEDTIAWWVGQSKRGCRMPSGKGYPIREVIRLMTEWLQSPIFQLGPKYTIWSQGAGFDIPIVEGYCRRLGINAPWRYHAARDTRTVYDLAGEDGWQKAPGEPSHDALEDCWKQIEDLGDALKVIRGSRP